jgi:hypothetical protein
MEQRISDLAAEEGSSDEDSHFSSLDPDDCPSSPSTASSDDYPRSPVSDNPIPCLPTPSPVKYTPGKPLMFHEHLANIAKGQLRGLRGE